MSLAILSDSTFMSYSEVIDFVARQPVLACDIETRNKRDDTIVGIGIAWSPRDGIYMDSADPRFQSDILGKLLSAKDTVWHNLLFDTSKLREQYNCDPLVICDTMLLGQSLGSEGSLSYMAGELGMPYTYALSLLEEFGVKALDLVPFNRIAEVCIQHAKATFKVYQEWLPKATKAYYIDMALMPVLERMHATGIAVDREAVDRLDHRYSTAVTVLKEQCLTYGFHPNKTMDIANSLLARGYPLPKTKKGTKLSTDKATLAMMQEYKLSPEINTLLSYRQMSKLHSTYVKPLLGKDVVYPKYHIVSTGRLASTGPNIQNQPPQVRHVFVPFIDEIMWDLDISQIEPMLSAYISGDAKMIAAVTSGDIYQPIANELHISRKMAKILLLAVSYGSQDDTLAEQCGIALADAHRLRLLFYDTYRGFKGWSEQIQADAARTYKVTTMLGRTRSLHDIAYDIEKLKREAVNTVIQGTASEILKIAMIALAGYTQVASVHDEILASIEDESDSPKMEQLVRDAINMFFNIPIRWKVGMGPSWAEAH